MLHAIHGKRFEEAEAIRRFFMPLEDLRNEINPIRVLHEAVGLAGIAQTGPLLPLVSPLDEASRQRIRTAIETMAANAATAKLHSALA